MSQRVFEPDYWKERLDAAKKRGNLWEAVYMVFEHVFEESKGRWRKILAREIKPTDAVLDAGCGWGRLLELMPKEWEGMYYGIDISPEFIEMAKKTYPTRNFLVYDLRRLSEITHFQPGLFDVAIIGSVKGMVLNNMGPVEWAKIEAQLDRVAKRSLVLEFMEE